MRLLLLGLALAAALSGCSSAQEPEPLPVPTGAVSPSATAAPAAASPSASALGDRQAVEAAVRFYYEGFNRALATGRAEELAKGSTLDCPCRSSVTLVADILRGGRVEGNRLTIRNIRIIEMNALRASTQVRYVSADGRVVAPDGREVEKLRGEPAGNSAVDLVKRNGTWLVSNVVGLRG